MAARSNSPRVDPPVGGGGILLPGGPLSGGGGGSRLHGGAALPAVARRTGSPGGGSSLWLLERPQSSTPGSCLLVCLLAAGKLPARLYPAHPHQASRDRLRAFFSVHRSSHSRHGRDG